MTINETQNRLEMDRRTFQHRYTRLHTATVWGAALLIAVFLALIIHPVAQSQQPDPQSAHDSPGVNDYDIVMVLDESASMWVKNDPRIISGTVQTNPGWRIVALNQLVGALATDQSGARYRLGLIMFGSSATVAFPLQPIDTPQAQATLKQAILSNHIDMSATNILPTLQLAREQLDIGGSTSKAKKLVIFLSDGVCEPVAQTTAQQQRACEAGIRQVLQNDYLQPGGIVIDTVALTRDAWASDLSLSGLNVKNMWQYIALKTGGDYYEAKQGEGELTAIFKSIQEHIFGLKAVSDPVSAASPGEQTFVIPANLTQAIFTRVTNNPSIKTILQRPDGTTVNSTDSGVKQYDNSLVQAITILQPAAGTWRIKSTGSGTITPFVIADDRKFSAAVDRPEFSIEMLSPGRLYPQNKPMEIQARVVDTNQVAQTVAALNIIVTLPDGTKVSPYLTQTGTDFTGQLSDTSKTGVYTLAFNGKLGNQVLTNQITVNVQTIPWLKLSLPQTGMEYKGVVPVSGQVMLGAGAISALPLGDKLQVVAHLINASGQEVDTESLHSTGQNGYSSSLSANTVGSYVARIVLSNVTAGGDTYEDNSDIPVSVLRGISAAPVQADPMAIVSVPTAIPLATAAAAIAVAPFDPFNLSSNLLPVYIAVAVIGVFLILMVIITIVQAASLMGIKKVFKTSVEMQDMIVKAWHVREVNAQLLTEYGWKSIADQLVADAMKEAVSIDNSAGILDISTEPSPKFTLITHDGRQVVFTTDPWAMKKMHLILRGDKVIDVSVMSRVSHLDADMLWMHMQDMRNLPRMAAPASAHWFIIMRGVDVRGYTTNSGLLRPGNVPYLEQASQLPAQGDNK